MNNKSKKYIKKRKRNEYTKKIYHQKGGEDFDYYIDLVIVTLIMFIYFQIAPRVIKT